MSATAHKRTRFLLDKTEIGSGFVPHNLRKVKNATRELSCSLHLSHSFQKYKNDQKARGELALGELTLQNGAKSGCRVAEEELPCWTVQPASAPRLPASPLQLIARSLNWLSDSVRLSISLSLASPRKQSVIYEAIKSTLEKGTPGSCQGEEVT